MKRCSQLMSAGEDESMFPTDEPPDWLVIQYQAVTLKHIPMSNTERTQHVVFMYLLEWIWKGMEGGTEGVGGRRVRRELIKYSTHVLNF